MKRIRVNTRCASYPCHRRLEDCTFCYCPFYPCMDEENGRQVVSSRTGRRIWSCEDCEWIHRKDVVDRILEVVREKGYGFFRE